MPRCLCTFTVAFEVNTTSIKALDVVQETMKEAIQHAAKSRATLINDNAQLMDATISIIS